jgi:AcrR family transcriptional regulator
VSTERAGATAPDSPAPEGTAPDGPCEGTRGDDSCTAAGAAGPARPLRRDAERNRQRILQAASEVFTERGLQATLDDVARRAGVGVGTVYRRFPGKEALAEALFAEQIAGIADLADGALADPDPWHGLTSFLEQAGSRLAADRGLRQLFMFSVYGRDQIGHARRQMQPVVTRLLERAQAAGVVRADLRQTDVPMLVFMLTVVADYAGHLRPDLWRRYLGLILDGMQPSRATTTELPEPALSPDGMELAMRTSPVRLELTKDAASAEAERG